MSLRIFPSGSRKFVRLKPQQAYESLVYLLCENLDVEEIQGEHETVSYVKAKLGRAIGATVNISILPEDGSSTLEFRFGYRNLLFMILSVLIAVMGLSLIWNTVIPMISIIVILPLAYKANFAVLRFLDTLNEALPHLEREYARMSFAEDRERWKREPKDVDDLYRRLCEKHIKTWGNTYALEYKIAEYERQGLNHEEAVRKTAEDEGIF